MAVCGIEKNALVLEVPIKWSCLVRTLGILLMRLQIYNIWLTDVVCNGLCGSLTQHVGNHVVKRNHHLIY